MKNAGQPVIAKEGVRTTVQLIPKDSAIKSCCFNEQTKSLRRNMVFVDRRGSIVFEINELGLKGGARDASKKLGVIWGDSVVFGVGRSWPCLLDDLVPQYQFLNGGIEGDPYDNIVERALAFNRSNAVAVNILMPGWHPICLPPHVQAYRRPRALIQRIVFAIQNLRRVAPPVNPTKKSSYNSSNLGLEARLLKFLHDVPNTVLSTMPTALNSKIVDRDLSHDFVRGDPDRIFCFAGEAGYSLELQRFLFDHITERNSIVRNVAQRTGKCLIDLAMEFNTEQCSDFREWFHDVLHLRPRAYPKAAAAVYSRIGNGLNGCNAAASD